MNPEEHTVLLYYAKLFTKLNRDRKFGGAPHKPVLLLAIIRLIRKGEITNRCIEITPELVLEFKDTWSKLVDTPHLANFALPFFHMRSEPFWNLVTKTGMEIPVTSSKSIKSLTALRESLAFAQVDPELFVLLQKEENRFYFEELLLNTYFQRTRKQYHAQSSLFTELEQQILTDDREEYTGRMDELQHTLTKEAYQEEVFMRSGAFKREIPKIYNYQCAISGMKIESLRNIQMIDACHIVPFSQSRNDTITNGISLSPNLHRAFDRGLITINNDYTIVVTTKIIESKSIFSLSQFEGKKILLPQNKQFYPAFENLDWHRKERFIR